MSDSTFCYVEFEPFADSGHRIHTANHYAEKLRGRGTFADYRIVAPPSRLGVTDLQRALNQYDVVDLSLVESLTPAAQETNIDTVGRSLTDALRHCGSGLGKSSLVYSHMPSPFALLALYVGIRALVDETGSSVHVLVRLCMIDEEWAWYRLHLSKLIVMIRSDPVVGRMFSFTTESRRLSAYYLERCGFEAKMQFNPFPEEELIITANKHRYHRALYGHHVQFAYLGEAREEKGFQYLPGLLDALRQSGAEFSLLVHAFSNPVNDTEVIRSAREALRGRVGNRGDLKLIEYPVPDSIYAAQLRRADVVVMPYLHGPYRIRGSGVAFEAIRGNAFILATEDLDLGITVGDSGRVIEYRPDAIDVGRLHEALSRVHAARSANWDSTHPAHLYDDCFFESVVDALRSTRTGTDEALAVDVPAKHRFLDLMRQLSNRRQIDDVARGLAEAGFALT